MSERDVYNLIVNYDRNSSDASERLNLSFLEIAAEQSDYIRQVIENSDSRQDEFNYLMNSAAMNTQNPLRATGDAIDDILSDVELYHRFSKNSVKSLDEMLTKTELSSDIVPDGKTRDNTIDSIEVSGGSKTVSNNISR